MPADPQFYGPLAYSGFWLFLGLALAAAAVGWVGYAVWSTLPPRAVDLSIPRAAPGLRRAYLGRIDEIEALLGAQEIGPRTAVQELSRLVRAFVQDATGVRTLSMTLADLRKQPVPAVAAAVEQFYPGEFSAAREQDVGAALDAARTVVRSWT